MRFVFIVAALFALPALAEEAPKTFILSPEQAAIVAAWATERSTAAQQQYQQATAILAELQKQAAPKPAEKK